MQEIVLATENSGKLAEFIQLTAGRPWRIYSLRDFPGVTPAAETGATFRENAGLKAASVAAATGLVTLADDSGLEVDFLSGRPGVLSARFCGHHGDDQANNEKLLSLLKGLPQEKRTARFRCAIAIALPGNGISFADGVCEGWIAESPRGSNGFGYDPIFVLAQDDRRMAELDMAEKNQISHRGQAFRAALPLLDRLLGNQ